jgi:hypothetical protein
VHISLLDKCFDVINTNNLNTTLFMLLALYNAAWNNFGCNSRSRKMRFVIIMFRTESGSSCRSLFNWLKVLPLPREYTFHLTNFAANNEQKFQNLQLYIVLIQGPSSIFMRQLSNFHCFPRSTYCASTERFSSLSSRILILMSEKTQFKVALKRHFNTNLFYPLNIHLMSDTITKCVLRERIRTSPVRFLFTEKIDNVRSAFIVMRSREQFFNGKKQFKNS